MEDVDCVLFSDVNGVSRQALSQGMPGNELVPEKRVNTDSDECLTLKYSLFIGVSCQMFGDG